MKIFALSIVAISLALPFAAQAQERMSEEQLVQLASERQVCGDLVPVAAKYDEADPGRVAITCSAAAQGFAPAAAGLGLGGAGAAAGLVLVVAAGGGSTNSTNGTN